METTSVGSPVFAEDWQEIKRLIGTMNKSEALMTLSYYVSRLAALQSTGSIYLHDELYSMREAIAYTAAESVKLPLVVE